MSENNSGVYRFLSNSTFYNFVQNIIFGRSNLNHKIVNDYIQPSDGMNLLDIGCGTGEMLSILNDKYKINYVGFDANEKYIQAAKSSFDNQGKFYHGYITQQNCSNLPEFDVVIAIGVLHHLNDDEAISLVRLAYEVLKSEGRFIAVDPVYYDGQHWAARFLVSKDRGENVRYLDEYESLLQTAKWQDIFKHIETNLLRLPYDVIFFECEK